MAKSSLDSVLGGRNLENIIRLLHDDGIEYIEETVGGMSLLERQIFFVNCIKVIDKSYYDYVMTKSDESATFFFDILKYAYPVLIKYLWTKDFETLMATPLARADSDDIYRCRVFLCSCRIVGQTEYILDMEKCGYVSVCSKNGICVIKCLQNNCWIEYFDSRWADFYENLLFSLMQNDKRITALQERWPIIKEEMRPLCFVWLKEFIGYNSTMNIESYFNDVAYYDAIHSTEWDYFPEQSKFNRVVLLLHHQVQIQPPLSQIPLVLILHLFKTDYQLNDIFPVEITMKNIEIIGRTGTIPFLEMKIQNSYTLEQGILKEFISVTENLGTRKDFGHGMVERDGREKTF